MDEEPQRGEIINCQREIKVNARVLFNHMGSEKKVLGFFLFFCFKDAVPRLVIFYALF